jgi:hypothetical protein
MRRLTCLILSLFLFFSLSYGEKALYNEQSLARLSCTTGNTFIQKSGDLAYEEGVVNMPIAEGDRINTTEGRAEIYIGNGNYVRLDFNTKVDFTKLPSLESDLIQIKLWTGNVIISLESLYREKNIEIHTTDISLYILDQGLYRINVKDNENTEIFVHEGIAEAAGISESNLLKDGQKLEAQQGYPVEPPLEFITESLDSFYEWSTQRDSIQKQHFAKKYLPLELDDFEYELNRYGHWNHMPSYGYVWVPSGIEPNWRPYYHGRWLWYPICGWTWLPYEPWGWVTFHYGRWHWSLNLGWYWIPTVRWGPAWVRWYQWNDYWAWVPMNYYGHPVVIINNLFYPKYNHNTYPSDSRALTVVHKDQLRSKNLSKTVVNPSSLRELENKKFYPSTPLVKDFPKSITIEKLDAQKVFLHHGESQLNKNDLRPSKALSEDKSNSSLKNFRDPIHGKTEIKEFGYPSSLRKKIENYITDKDSKPIVNSPSIVEKAFKYFSSGKTQYIKSRTDPVTRKSSSKITSSSIKRSPSISRTNQSVSKNQTKRAVSKTRKSSGSQTAKKKKK